MLPTKKEYIKSEISFNLSLHYRCYSVFNDNQLETAFSLSLAKQDKTHFLPTKTKNKYDDADMKIEPPLRNTNNISVVPREDSDQPKHTPSLIRVLAIRREIA